jgi:type I restriction enzyme S subunit
MGNIQDGRLDWSDLVFTSEPKEIEKYRLESGDVLSNRTNSPELVGKTALYKGERKAIFAGYLIRIRCGHELVPDALGFKDGATRALADELVQCWKRKSK